MEVVTMFIIWGIAISVIIGGICILKCIEKMNRN